MDDPPMNTLPADADRRVRDDGLVVRWSTADDLPAIQALYAYVFRGKADEPANERTSVWVADALAGRHPLTSGADACAVVVDPAHNTIVASVLRLSATWEYAGIAFGVGRPEVVATHPEYRNRGLIRDLFALFHARSAAAGELVQGITGIPYFYRQLGYEFALDLGGSQACVIGALPPLAADAAPDPVVRPATLDDIPFLRLVYERERTRQHHGLPLLVSARIDAAYWHWQIAGQHPRDAEGWQTWVISMGDHDVGYVLTRRVRSERAWTIVGLALEPGASLTALLPGVLRRLAALAPTIETWREPHPAPIMLEFRLGAAHPVYDLLPQAARGVREQPYAWYIRVADLPQFIQRIAPALERRLLSSPLAGYDGTVRLDFYRDGLQLQFQRGRLLAATPWRSSQWGERAQAYFPPGVVLQLLFGRRSLGELAYSFPDAYAEGDAEALLEVLFPKQQSWALPQD
jgi:hypothetical protein